MKRAARTIVTPLADSPTFTQTVAHALGHLVRPFALVFLVPAAIDAAAGAWEPMWGFVAGSLTALALGSLLVRARGQLDNIGRTEALVTVALIWLLVASLGAIPFVAQGFSPIDGLFESMSGFTGTGSSVFQPAHWSTVSSGLLFWRSFSQWVGGLGIIVLFVAILPALAVAGRQMFFAEASGVEEESLTPRVRNTAKRLWRLYCGLTLIEVLLLRFVGGVSFYDAFCHAFSTLSAGGFSPHATSAAALGYLPQWIILPFMFLAGASFHLQHRSLRNPLRMLADPEFRTYLMLVVFAGLLVALFIAPQHNFSAALRHGFFQVVSVLTATGFASEDFNTWHRSAVVILCMLMFIGGCAGSAGGGPKVIRLMLVARYMVREILIVIHPRAVRHLRLRGRALDPSGTRQIIGFVLVYFAIFAATGVLVGVFEHNLEIGFTGSITTLGNIGPGLGAIGPMGTFAGLHATSKALLVFNMWAGRLEVMAVLVLFHPDVARMFVARDPR